MKIILASGGEGSTFIYRAFRKQNYDYLPFSDVIFKYTRSKNPEINTLSYKISSKISALHEKYFSDFKIMKRPGNFINEVLWSYETHSYKSVDKNKKEILNCLDKRSSDLEIESDNLNFSSITKLVKSYMSYLKDLEDESSFEIILLLSGQLIKKNVFEKIGSNIPRIYIIRDPFNALISYSKPVRHRHVLERYGYTGMNDKGWIDFYLKKEEHIPSWVEKAKQAIDDDNGHIVRYSSFEQDWKKIPDVPDITDLFHYSTNTVREKLTSQTINYIREETLPVIEELDLPKYC